MTKIKTRFPSVFVGVDLGGKLRKSDYKLVKQAIGGKYRFSSKRRKWLQNVIDIAHEDTANRKDDPPTAEVFAHLDALAKPAAKFAKAWRTLNDKKSISANQDPANQAYLLLQHHAIIDHLAQGCDLLASRIDEIKEIGKPEPAKGKQDRELTDFIINLWRLYKQIAGKKARWVSNTNNNTKNNTKKNRPSGPFFKFVKVARSFVRGFPETTDLGLQTCIKTARKEMQRKEKRRRNMGNTGRK